MNTHNLYIIDDSLINKLGHYYEYDRSIYQGAEKSGLSCCVLSNLRIEEDIKKGWNIVPTFFYHTDSHLLKWSRLKPLAELFNIVVSNFFFFLNLTRNVSSHAVGANVLFFLPNVRQYSFFGALLWYALRRPSKRSKLILLFRYEYRRFTLKKMVQLAGLIDKQRIRFVTDSELLAKDYESMTGSPFQVLPIPHTIHVSKTNIAQRTTKIPVKFVSLGGPRLEKGIETLTDAIPFLEEELNKGVIEFDIQVNAPKKDKELNLVIDRLFIWSKKYKGINLLYNSLSTDDYYKLIHSSDVVLLPYKSEFYYSRTSGPLTEALALGKPVITTVGTWMSLQLQSFGSGLTFNNDDAADLARAIKELAQRVNEYSIKSLQSRDLWIAKHNAQNFCSELYSLYGEKLAARL